MASTKWKAFKIRHAKQLKVALICAILVALVLLIINFVPIVRAIYINTDSSEKQQFIISSELFMELDGISPSDLTQQWIDDFNEWNIDYEVDSDGNLVLYMGERVVELWRGGYLECANASVEHGVKISSDYTRVEFDATTPTGLEGTVSPWGVIECAWIQILNGVPSDEVKVEVVAMNYKTDEVVYQATWPKDDISYKFVEKNRTITYTIKDGVANVYQMPIKD